MTLPTLLLLATLQASSPVVLLEFTAPWCGPCQQMSPIVAKLQREGAPIRPVDYDRNRELAQHYNVTGIPTFVLLVNGQEAGRVVGKTDENALRGLLSKAAAMTPQPKEPTEIAATEPPPKKRNWIPLPWQKSETKTVAATDPSAEVRGQSPDPVENSKPIITKDPVASSVRIRVKDERGLNLGSGTIIACQGGKALVLTCSHLFRGFGESSKIEVDTFPAGPDKDPVMVSGYLLQTDPDADLGLIGITDCGNLPRSPVAGSDRAPQPSNHVFSIGCGNGELPTKLQHSVTQLNRYQGPDTIECTGLPVVGRSGGGLFDTEGRVIGVCIAATREEQRGVYAGLKPVHALLEQAGFATLIPAAATAAVQVADASGGMTPPPSPPDQSEFETSPLNVKAPPQSGPIESPFGGKEKTVSAPNPATAATATASATPFDPGNLSASAAASAANGSGSAATRNPAASAQPRFQPAGSDNDPALAALAGGAEVTCIIRDAAGNSEVVVINKASKKFLHYLRGELDAQPTETAAVLPAPVQRANVARPAGPQPTFATGSCGSRPARPIFPRRNAARCQKGLTP